ncbi:MAG: hypothetical protein ACRDOO_21745 [Actinomadura sp.]
MEVGSIRVGWSPCQCPPALGCYRGHRTYQCERCDRSGWRTVSYNPEHLPADGTRGHHPGTTTPRTAR